MTRSVVLLATGLLFFIVLALGSGGIARAQQPEPGLTLRFQDGIDAGTQIELAATLLDPAGNPIAGVPIEFTVVTEFLNNTGEMEIGSISTDQDGVATLVYAPRIEGEREIEAVFAGNEIFAASSITEILFVEPGPEIYLELSPVRVPGANKWMAAAVLLVVWGLFLSSMVRVWLIARIGSQSEGAADA